MKKAVEKKKQNVVSTKKKISSAKMACKEKKQQEKKFVFPQTPKGSFLSELSKSGIKSSVIEAFNSVEQEQFFDRGFFDRLYKEGRIPIGYGQVSDEFASLAKMIDVLNPKEEWRILEVGTGSGYSTAVLSLLCREVVTIDIKEELVVEAKSRLYKNDYGNIRFFSGDGTEDDSAYGNIDAVIIHAACRKRPLSVLANLKAGGRVVYPMGPAHVQQITVLDDKEDDERKERFTTRFYDQCISSPIQGAYGYDVPMISIQELFAESDGAEPPKSLEPDTFLFKPNTD